MFRKAIHDFAARVASLDDLPPSTAAAIRQHTSDAAIQALLTLPSQRYPLARAHRWRVLPFGWRLTPDRVLAYTPEALLVAETDAAGNVTVRGVPLDAVLVFEVTVNLLYGCLALHWVEDGRVVLQNLEFSTVGLHMMRTALDAWRKGLPYPPVDPAPGTSLAALPLKFRNYLRTALLPGEAVRAACFLPEVPANGGWLRSRRAPNRTVAFTDWHVIVLEEDTGPRVANYSLTTRCLPWRGVRGLDLVTQPDGLVEAVLTLGLDGVRQTWRWRLDPAAAEALRAAFTAQAAERVMA